MKKFVITTLGCRVNQFESDSIASILKGRGWEKAGRSEKADVCIINTCTVTGKASMQSRQAIRAKIREHEGATVVVTGCYAQTEAEEIKKIEGVTHVLGQKEKQLIPDLLETGAALDELKAKGLGDSFSCLVPSIFEERTRPYLKIQDGCEAFCTYCIVPYARGKSRSMAFDDVLLNLRRIRDQGAQEAVLTGIHLGAYGHDLDPKTNLKSLLQKITSLDDMPRIRLSSIEPRELAPEIIELAASTDRICHHFHIPLQSGDADILKRMGRPYTPEYFAGLVKSINEKLPSAAIGVDVLTGFPGETDEFFRNTFNLLESLPIAYVHAFPFSPRKGTPAATFKEQIHPEVMKARCAEIREMGQKKKTMFYGNHVGKTLDMMVESKRDKKTGMLKGISGNYISMLAEGPAKHMNTLVRVKAVEIGEPGSMICRIED
ncbi:tRNA (N(6)-L-threonylcarbamoyladenosine(37)-C(2))-methylthiotransferase MtaB [Desulforegula conservatrix]|uniref:tRNA (N(6)-L-threonylcarbamoyladenosine(37)-C(2))- methylthiotransferase MtaB n=1 Tax=Desulforegula conservatrix TaxID=153026 RepID=UPI00040C0C90|nr:tRNA (N(6)-L-threonylcarbamoyladenosine(37)-C(2))-methylthiotransferase MtaB [Desulforegula conservatrix]